MISPLFFGELELGHMQIREEIKWAEQIRLDHLDPTGDTVFSEHF